MDILELNELQDYLRADFDAGTHAQDIIKQNIDIQPFILKVQQGLSDQITQNEDKLHSSLGILSTMDSIVSNLSENFDGLLKYFTSLERDMKKSLEESKALSNGIAELTDTLEMLKLLEGFLLGWSRLKSMDDYARQATFCFELDQIAKERLFQVHPIISDEFNEYLEYRDSLWNHGMLALENGLSTNDNSEIQKGVQLFINLRSLREVVERLLQKYWEAIANECKLTFDASSINLEMKKVPQQAKNGVVQWAQLLWVRVEKLIDLVYQLSVKIINLHAYLSKTNVVSQLSHLATIGLQDLFDIYSTKLGSTLENEITLATKQSAFLLQVLQAGYPKFLRIFRDLYSKIELISDQLDLTPTISTMLQPFETAYINRVSQRMIDVLGTDRLCEVDKIGKSIHAELGAVKFDTRLLRAVGEHILHISEMYRTRLGKSLKMAVSFRIAGSNIGSSQLAKIEAINNYYILSEYLWDASNDFEDSEIENMLVQECTLQIKQMSDILEIILKELIDDFWLIIDKLWREEKKMADILSKIRWVFREVFGKLKTQQCVDISKLFIERLIKLVVLGFSVASCNETRKQKIVQDLNELEYTISQSLLVLGSKDHLESFNYLSFYKEMLFTSLSSFKISNELDPIILCNFLISKSEVIPHPSVQYGWEMAEYLRYLDSHKDEDCIALIKESMSEYLQKIEQEGLNQTCLELPVLRGIILEWEKRIRPKIN